jgi:hypothetical protein
MSDTLTRNRVPAQYLGAARQYRRDVRAEDHAFDAALAALIKPLSYRLQRHPRLRWGHVLDTERRYRATIPQKFRIGDLTVHRDRAAFNVTERRVAVSWIANPKVWGEDYHELGVSLCTFTLSVRDGKLRQEWMPHASLSLHSLARWFERSRYASPEALLADIAVLIDADMSSGQIPTPDGMWRAT